MTQPLPLEHPLPWHAEVWGHLVRARHADRLGHALLLAGPEGIGKRHLVEMLARALLCAHADSRSVACGHCSECQLVAAGSHPDLMRIGPDPETKSGEIPIAAVRGLCERGALTASRGGWKVAIIDPADRMSTSAANALLKTLEEPPGRFVLCLIAEQLGRLPATVRSRCQSVRIGLPAEPDALAWLEGQRPDAGDHAARLRLAKGAPLRALALDAETLARRQERFEGLLALARGERDPVLEAAAWNQCGPGLLLEWLAGWCSDLLRCMASRSPPWLESRGLCEQMADLGARIDAADAHRYLQQVLQARRLVGTNVNLPLLLESLAIQWSRLCVGEGPRRD